LTKLLPWVGSHREGELGGGEDVDSSAGSDALVVGVDKWHRWSRGGGLLLRTLEWRKWRREWSSRVGKGNQSEEAPAA
jgi:hypothetical protein